MDQRSRASSASSRRRSPSRGPSRRTATDIAAAGEAGGEKRASSVYRWYVVGLLTVIATLGSVDRQLVFVLGEAIKQDLSLTDTQLGLVGGAAFAIFYTVLVLPVASLADRTSRKWVIVVAVGIWSLMTALAGRAGGFATMFAARVGVAVGESGCAAPSQSIIAATFPPERRAMAISVFALGATLGVLMSFAFGGWLAGVVGWRGVFYAFGIAGLAVAALAAFTLKEPPVPVKLAADSKVGVLAAARTIGRRRTLALVTAATTLHAFSSSGIMAWLAPFVMRAHGFTVAEAGMSIGAPAGLAGSVGVILGGLLAQRLTARDPRWQLLMPGLGLLISTPIYLFAFLAAEPTLFMAGLLAGVVFSASPAGPSTAAVLNLAHPAMRATTAALVSLIAVLIGGGAGPTLVGAISDALAPRFGDDSLRLAICAALVFPTAAGVTYLLAARTLPADLGRPD